MFGFIARIAFERKCVVEMQETAGIPRKTAADFVLAYRDLIEETRITGFNHINATATACLYVLEHRERIYRKGPGFEGVQHVLVAWAYGLGHIKRSPMSALNEEFIHHVLSMKRERDDAPDLQLNVSVASWI